MRKESKEMLVRIENEYYSLLDKLELTKEEVESISFLFAKTKALSEKYDDLIEHIYIMLFDPVSVAFIEQCDSLTYYDKMLLRLGIILHDVGKTTIPLEILNKNGRLTDDEYELIKPHAFRGVLLADQCVLPTIIYNCITKHHERIGGRGYPYKLKDFEPEVHIIGILDTYSALKGKRKYQYGKSNNEIIAIFQKDASLFLKEYYDAFIEAIR